MACHRDNKLENSVEYSERGETEQRGKEIEIDKKNLHLMLSILSFLLFLYKFYIEETKLSGYSEHDSAVDMLNQKFPLVVQVVHRGRGNERL